MMEPDEEPLKKDERICGIRRGTLEVIIMLLILVFALGFFIGVVSGSGNATELNATIVTVVPTGAITPTPTPIVKIVRLETQGQCVEPGQTIDMSGIGWYTGYIAYYGRYRTLSTEGTNSSLVKVYELPTWELRKYYIDPEKFRIYPGNWYTHYDRDESGNSKLFYVSSNCTAEFSESPVNKTPIAVENKTMILSSLPPLLPKVVPGVDYVISRNTNTILNCPFDSHVWIFGNGNTEKYYDAPVINGTVNFSRTMTNDIPAGKYSVIFVTPGENNIIEEIYDRDAGSISSPFRTVADRKVGGMTSTYAMNELIAAVSDSIDDGKELWVVDLQDPSVEIRDMNQQLAVDGINTITLAGYTNANSGSKITIALDTGNIDEKLVRANTWVATVNPVDGAGTYRQWNTTFTMNFNDFPPGMHTLYATTSTGVNIGVPLYIRKEPAEHYQPEKYIQFVDNNPFIPTPTPITLPAEKIVVTQTVIKVETVQIPVDYNTLAKHSVEQALPYVIAGLIGVIVLSYAVYVGSRAYMIGRRKRNAVQTEQNVEQPKENV